MPFAPLPPDEPIGIAASFWRFSSALTQNSTGRIELCFAEEGKPERILGSVEIRPFVSSDSKLPDLRILFARDLASAERKVVLIVGYGIRSAVIIQAVSGLTANSLVMSAMPRPDAKGEITLLGYGDNGVAVKEDGLDGVRGRLFFRYVPQD